jgi:hypothetical protein
MMWIFFSHHLVVNMVKLNEDKSMFSAKDAKTGAKRYGIAVAISFLGIIAWVSWGSYYTFIKTITGKDGGYAWMDKVLFPKDDGTGYEKMSGGGKRNTTGQSGGAGFFDTMGEVAGNSLRKQQDKVDSFIGSTIMETPWQGFKDKVTRVYEFLTGIITSFLDALALVPGNTIPHINKTVLTQIHNLSNKVFKGKERDSGEAGGLETFVYTLFGPMIMCFVTVWGLARILFQGVIQLFTPEIWAAVKVMKEKGGGIDYFASTFRVFTTLLIGVPIGAVLVAWNSVSYALKYICGGLFLSMPQKEYDGFRSSVFDLFTSAWPITAALMWLSVTIVSPASVKEFSTTFTTTFATLGIAALIYAIKGGSWNLKGD